MGQRRWIARCPAHAPWRRWPTVPARRQATVLLQHTGGGAIGRRYRHPTQACPAASVRAVLLRPVHRRRRRHGRRRHVHCGTEAVDGSGAVTGGRKTRPHVNVVPTDGVCCRRRVWLWSHGGGLRRVKDVRHCNVGHRHWHSTSTTLGAKPLVEGASFLGGRARRASVAVQHRHGGQSATARTQDSESPAVRRGGHPCRYRSWCANRSRCAMWD